MSRHPAQSVVINANDSGPGSLRYAIANTAASGTITFTSTLAGATIVLTGGELLLSGGLTIDASALPGGITINGNASSRIFDVESGIAPVTLNSLTITGGSMTSFPGGGLYNSGTLVMNQCVVSNNSVIGSSSSPIYGGGLYNSGTLTLNQCVVSSNVVHGFLASQILGEGGGLYTSNSVTLTACTLSGNVAGTGGGIFNISACLLTNCTLSGNAAGAGYTGGGIYNYSGNLSLNQCTLSGNAAPNGGGAILLAAGTVNLNQSTVSANSAPIGGGGLTLFSGSFTMTNSIVAGNAGGDVDNVNGTFNAPGPNLTNGTPLLAPLGNYGGPTQTMPPLPGSPALDAGSDSATNLFSTDQRGYPRLSGTHVDIGAVELQAPIVTTAADSGPGSLRVAASGFVDASASITFASNLSGQTIALTSGELLLNENLTINGAALAQPVQISGSHSSRVFEIASGSTVTLDALTITGGASGSGGGLYNSGTLTLNQCVVSSNSASRTGPGVNVFGGGLYNSGTLTLNQCVVSSNSASRSSGGAGTSVSGGGLYNSGMLTLNQCLVSSNSASRSSGTNVFGGGLFSSGTVAINQCTMSGNTAQTGGGVDMGGGTVNLNQSTVSANSASSGQGGGLYLTSGSCNVTNSIVAGNTGGDLFNSGGSENAPGPNLIGVAPLLSPLGNYGGPTQTMPPLPGSPALDAASDSATNLFSTDQRGFPRLSGAHVDIGAVEFQTPVVTTNADSGPGSLRAAIGYVDAGASITFAPNLSGQTIALTGGELLLNKNFTIDGSTLAQSVQISGSQASRVFEIASGSTVTVDALTITGGNASNANGGGVLNSGTVTLTACTLSDNTALDGGGLFSSGTVAINQCTLAGNVAQLGGGIDMAEGTVNLNQSTVSANSASGHGGGLYLTFGSCNVTNSIVAGNTGGDEYNYDGSFIAPSPNLINVAPVLSPLGNYGGPIQTMPPLLGSPAIDTGNDSATNLFSTDQRGYPRLSGFHVDIGSVEFQAPVVTNTADSGPGSLRTAIGYADAGGTITLATNLSGQTILLTGGELFLNKDLTINGSALTQPVQISGNQASRVFVIAGGSTVTLDALTITGGYENGAGAGIDNSGTLTLNQCLVSGNGAYGGGGMYNTGTLTMNQCIVSSNSASGAFGGGLYNDYGAMATLTACTLSANSVPTGSGGGIHNAGNLSLNQCTLSGNTAQSGAGIDMGGGTVNLNQSTVSANSASSGQGGGLYLTSGTCNVTNSIVAGNTGGDLFNSGGSENAPGPNLIGVAPLLSPLGNYGGPTQTMPPLPGSPALDAASDSATNLFSTDQRGFPRLSGAHVDIGAVELQAAIVTTNADSGPGSLRDALSRYVDATASITFAPNLSGQTITLTSEELILNTNLTIDGSALAQPIQISGGGNRRVFLISGGTVTLDALIITGGYINGSGGGVYNSGTLTLNQCTLSNNYVQIGGAGIFNDGTCLLNNCTLSENYADTGGGIGNSGTLTLNQCTLSNNYVSIGGGGIFNDGTCLLNNSTLSGNAVGGGYTGGGIDNNSGNLSLNNCTLSGNAAPDGGGIFVAAGTVNLNQSTVSTNTSFFSVGGGVALEGGLVNLTNSIVAGNAGGDVDNVNGTFNAPGPNLTNGTPLLAPLGNYGGPTQTMPPLPGSPALDAGSDSATNLFSTDQRGYPRLSGAHVDIGAVELQAPIVATTADSGPGSLRAAIGYVDPGNSITFATNLSGQTLLLTSGELLLNKNFTIDGSALAQPLQISGSQSSRVFEIASNSTVTLDALTITGGSVTDDRGGGVLNSGTLTLNQCVVSNNADESSSPVKNVGGGVYNSGTLVMNECVMSSNTAVTPFPNRGGGGLFNDISGTATLTACTLSANSVPFGDGGGIYDEGNLLLNLCTLSGNGAAYDGGGIFMNGGTANLNQSTVSSNTSYYSVGGGLLLAGGSVINLTNSIVAGNTGGDVYNYDGTFNATGPNLTNGMPLLSPLGNYGGPTQTMPPLLGSPALDAGSDSATNLFLTDQRGLPRLSGPHVDLGAAEAQYSTLVVSNTADNGTGSLRAAISNASASFTTITFASNLSGQTIALTSGELLVNKNLTIDGLALARSLQISASQASRVFEIASNSTVILNALTLTGGSPVGTNGGGVLNSGTLTLNQCLVSNNAIIGSSSSPLYGGGLYNSGALTLNQCLVTSNAAVSIYVYGGGLYNSGTLVMNECLFASNSSSGLNTIGFACGGGLCNDFNGTATLTTCTVMACTVSPKSVAANGAISLGGGIYNNGACVLANCTLSGNAAATDGGGIYNNSGGVSLNQCTLSGNTAPYDGGGVDIGDGTATLNQSTVSANSATPVGGGLFVTFGSCNLIDSIVAGNTGGDVYNYDGSFNATGPNVISLTPLLAPLGNYGGPTQTMPPLPGSPAIDACTNGTSFATDQRGLPRILGLFADAGAVEGVYNSAGPGS